VRRERQLSAFREKRSDQWVETLGKREGMRREGGGIERGREKGGIKGQTV